MREDSRISVELLDKYLSGAVGEASAEESSIAREWLAKHPEQVGIEPARDWDTRGEWSRIADRMEAREDNRVGVYSSGSLRRWIGYSALACALLAIVIGYTSMAGIHRVSVLSRIQVHTTQRGQYAKLNLPDGSTVLVAPATTISYTSDFGKHNRELSLQGGALFTVVNDGHPPFIVKTNTISSRVLGTTFAVRKFAEDSTVTVVVAEGKVEVAVVGREGRSVLTMGDQLQIANSGVSLKRGIDISSTLGWATGRLDFRDTPFTAVLSEVSRAYNLDLRTSSERLRGLTINLLVERMSPNSVVDMIAAISGSQAVSDGRTIIFKEQQ